MRDKECETKGLDIIEETKIDLDWLLEDLRHIKQAKEDSKHFCEGTQIGDTIKL